MMKTSLAVFLLAANFSVAADSLAPLRGRHAQQRQALEQRHRQESLKLIEQQLAELEALAKQSKGREAKRVREAIEVLLKSTDARRKKPRRRG